MVERIDQASKIKGGEADVDMLDSLVKLSQGGGQVTEAQINAILGGRSLADTLAVAKQKVGQGGILSPQQRQRIVQLAHSIYNGYRQKLEPLYNAQVQNLKDQGIPKQYWNLPDLNNLAPVAEQTGAGQLQEGQTATNSTTGQKIVVKNGQWVDAQTGQPIGQ